MARSSRTARRPRAGRRGRVDARELRARRDLRRGLVVSLAAHGGLVLLLAFAPSPPRPDLPPVVTVDLVAAVAPRRSRPAAPEAPEPAPAPAPAPTPAPPPEPAPPVQEKVILPEKPPPVPDEPEPEPEPRPEPPEPPPQRPEPRPELEYEDALAALRDELGESAPQPAEPGPAPEAPVAPEEGEAVEGAGGPGVQVPPEVLRWIRRTRAHVRSAFVTPPEFRDRRLRTCMSVFLTADGRVIGEPEVTRSSGDVYWDDNAVRAVMRASPLPTPPEEGDWPFCFSTEERR